ncbi:MAG: hypothetical protein DHS20C21_04920 [Gemmatimonadota bacterium]|nr:MAG: hypothetical protein DHS20C21_04920 [Gemmatimonadota bacterium]
MALTLILAGCSTDREPGDLFAPSNEGTIVLDAVLIVDAPFPSVYLSRSAALDEDFTRDGVAVRGADVRIESGGGEILVRYADAIGPAGRYDPAGPNPSVLPETEYRIRVMTADGELVTAVTQTPARFQVTDWVQLDARGEAVQETLATVRDLGDAVFDDPRNRIPYAEGLLEARFDRPDVPAFQVGVVNLEEDSDLVVDSSIFSEEDLQDLDRQLSSPPLAADAATLRLPWFAIFYGGRTMVRIFALDENWYDLVRTSPELSGQAGAVAFGGNLGDAFDRPVFHVQGGIGLFGSASVDSNAFFVLPEEK